MASSGISPPAAADKQEAASHLQVIHLSLHVQFSLIRLGAIFCGEWETFHRFDWLTIIDVAPSARIWFEKKIVLLLQSSLISRFNEHDEYGNPEFLNPPKLLPCVRERNLVLRVDFSPPSFDLSIYCVYDFKWFTYMIKIKCLIIPF